MSPTPSDVFVSVVAPLRNDATIVREFVRDVMGVLHEHYANFELVLVDDGSRDGTVHVVTELLKEFDSVRFIRLSREFGEEIAISAGLDSVIGDFVVVMLPNSDPPALIPVLVQRVRSGVGIVFGIRRQRVGESLLVRFGASVWYRYARRYLRLQLPENSAQLRAFSRQAINAIVQIRDRYRYLRILSADVGYATLGVPYDPINRNPSRPQRSFVERVGVSFDIIVANSQHPLRFATFLGLAASIVNLVYAGVIVARYVLGRAAGSGATTAIALQTAVMFFFVFLILAVMSEYLGHVLVESRDRPLYYVLEERDSPLRIASGQRRNVVTESVASTM